MAQSATSETLTPPCWKIAVASANPAKVTAVRDCFNEVFPHTPSEVQGYAVPSGVAAQPMSSEETLLGAQNRIVALKKIQQADFYVSIEAGLDDGFTFAWMLIEHQGKQGMARSASLMLPPAALTQLQSGAELGDVMDLMFSTNNIKQAGGAIALLTGNRLSRSSVYQQALILALIPFLQPDLF